MKKVIILRKIHVTMKSVVPPDFNASAADLLHTLDTVLE